MRRPFFGFRFQAHVCFLPQRLAAGFCIALGIVFWASDVRGNFKYKERVKGRRFANRDSERDR